jgi:hypothetical protein
VAGEGKWNEFEVNFAEIGTERRYKKEFLLDLGKKVTAKIGLLVNSLNFQQEI